ncbi:hypothetical protein BDC45DRAFT_563768 [Circinella umbellata]|nr:hypothetical protein BDC45DRAFT_563768 [Circinella umbellata]
MTLSLLNYFNNFRQHALASSENNLFQIKSSVHNLLALSHILLRCPQQHSKSMINDFSSETLECLCARLIKESVKTDMDISNETYGKIARTIDSVSQKKISKDQATSEPLCLCMTVDECTASVIRGVSNAMSEPPFDAIKDKSTASKRPDAMISMYEQLSFGSSLGFGEAKIAQPRTNNHDLCHDLLRLAMFCKETIDKNYLTGCISFQIHGFTYNNYLLSHAVTTRWNLYHVGDSKVGISSITCRVSTFVSLKKLVILIQASEILGVFVNLVLDKDRPQLINSRRPSHPDIHKLIDST